MSSAKKQKTNMETVQFYDDTHNPWLNKKKTMTLDLVNGGPTKKRTSVALLSTPDVQMLKLASPELEKMIISQQGTVCTTPTPTQFICPKNVTEEQAAFAQGFVEALQSLHQTQSHVQGEGEDGSGSDHEDNKVALMQVIQQAPAQQNSCIVTTATAVAAAAPLEYNPAMPTTTALPGATVSYPSRTSAIATTMSTVDTSVITNNGWSHLPHIKQEPEQSQIVPVFNGHGTPPLSPINMESQERIKAERKRLRNRVAASKCRRRKLERISRLEEKVKELKDQNTQLSTTATKLREQVCQLKQSVMEHVKNGCQVMLAQQLAF
ncbi:transcription factor AP-1-like [Acanthaster planci]|uniref:Transcription factor AP-1-like n=1 Tax=Acanthaster planci TaxID=133434 RepID=A0A8B7Y5W2_ACAPL|nr:transcription factor AP-1-like [Acanthaster planci]